MKFGDTKVLVPVGEGNITVEELISKAIEKFRKVKKLVSYMGLITHSISSTPLMGGTFQTILCSLDRDQTVHTNDFQK